MNPVITVSGDARDHIKKMIEKNKGLGLRLSVKKNGCSGYAYLPSIADTLNPADLVVEVAEGVTVFLDSTWLSLLQGVHVDFAAEPSALKQKRLVFMNEKEKGRCGCGESFHIE